MVQAGGRVSGRTSETTDIVVVSVAVLAPAAFHNRLEEISATPPLRFCAIDCTLLCCTSDAMNPIREKGPQVLFSNEPYPDSSVCSQG